MSSIENNNPGNLRPLTNGKAWKGQTGVNAGFVVFDSMENGIRALAINATVTIKRGYNTINKFVNHYAPASDGNDPSVYARTLTAATGLAADAIIPLNQDTIYKLISGIIHQENGHDANLISDSNISDGLASAEDDRPNLYKTSGPQLQEAGFSPWMAAIAALFLLNIKNNSHAM